MGESYPVANLAQTPVSETVPVSAPLEERLPPSAMADLIAAAGIASAVGYVIFTLTGVIK